MLVYYAKTFMSFYDFYLETRRSKQYNVVLALFNFLEFVAIQYRTDMTRADANAFFCSDLGRYEDWGFLEGVLACGI